uniref:PAN2-PAN3 deadenylation complex subunit PAN3 n=1 Tax=Psilocybe cubensis TaxID=181762 RepID=A0A8H7XVS5_PSICU
MSPAEAAPPPPTSPAPRIETPSVAALTPQAVNAPVFVPNSPLAISEDYLNNGNGNGHGHDTHLEGYQDTQIDSNQQSEYDNYDYSVDQTANAMQGMDFSDGAYYDDGQREFHAPNPYSDNMMETSYYTTGPVFLRQPLNYLLYTPSMPKELIRDSTNNLFVPPSTDLRQILQERSETIRQVAPMGLNLPEELQGYHTLVPLEPVLPNLERKKFGNWLSMVYRAIRTSDGIPHALRRIENFRLTHQAAFAPIEKWSNIQHPSIVPVREAFTTRSFNDNSLVVSYAYYPNAKTLYDAHMKPKPPPTYQQTVYYGRHQQLHQLQQAQQTIPERTLWSYIIQLASAIKKVHSSDLAVRMIDVTKVLVTGQNRVRISSCGIFDVLAYGTPQQDVAIYQQEDLNKLGRLIFALCTNNLAASSQANLQKSMETMKKFYSVELQTVALSLIGKAPKTIDKLLEMIRGATDRLEHELLGELENARLFRLMCKFGFINERPEFARDARWSETGDRYIIKLFRDYVFHQVDEHGNPVLDLSHVLTCLNKLDAGTDEQIMLVARDEQSCLVVSYKEIKSCVASAFE